MARPRLELDAALVEKLCNAQLTDREIALICKCSVDTLTRRFADSLKEWKSEGVASIRRHLFTQAMGSGKGCDGKPNMTAVIFFLKNYGGLADVSRDATPTLGLDGLPIGADYSTPRTHKPN